MGGAVRRGSKLQCVSCNRREEKKKDNDEMNENEQRRGEADLSTPKVQVESSKRSDRGGVWSTERGGRGGGVIGEQEQGGAQSVEGGGGDKRTGAGWSSKMEVRER